MAQQTFTKFPDLPTELQIKIFKNSFPSPRVVPIEFDDDLKQ